MKKYLLLFALLICSVQSFGQIQTPDGYIRKLYGNYQFIYDDSTGADTVAIYPGLGVLADTLYFQDGTKQYSGFSGGDFIGSTGDTISGANKKWRYNGGSEIKLITDALSAPCVSTYTTITEGNIVLRSCDGFYQYNLDISPDSIISDGTVFSMPNAQFTGDLSVSGTINGLYCQSDNTTLADDASITFTAGTYGWGEVYVFNSGAMVEWAEFIFNSDGTVTLKANSATVVNTDTDNKFCIYDAGSQFAIRNRLGGNRTVKYIIHH